MIGRLWLKLSLSWTTRASYTPCYTNCSVARQDVSMFSDWDLGGESECAHRTWGVPSVVCSVGPGPPQHARNAGQAHGPDGRAPARARRPALIRVTARP